MKMDKYLDYWNKNVPMNFLDKPDMTYEEKRKFRYFTQDYMYSQFNRFWFPNSSVLELGCGSGIDALEFARNGANVTALDFSDASMESVTKSSKESGTSLRIVKHDVNLPLPFEDGAFDVVYSFGVLHHVPRITFVINEIRRVLKNGGLFMGMVYNRDSLNYAYLKCNGMGTERIEGCPYVKFYTKATLEKLLNGFENVDIRAEYNVIDLPTQRKVRFQLFNCDVNLGWHLIFHCRKG